MADTKEAKKGQKECIWMKMGMVSYRICSNNYQCGSCEFDQQMQSGELDGGSGFAKMAERMRFIPASQRKCRYMMAGLVPYKICSNSYECFRCEYDQAMQDVLDQVANSSFAQKRKEKAAKSNKVRGYLMPLALGYHKNHLWVRVDKDGIATVGLDDFAQKLIGPITYVVLPETGANLEQGLSAWNAGRDERVALGVSPIQGIVAAVNKDVVDNPGLINKDPYGGGWLFKIDTGGMDVTKSLLSEKSAEQWLEGEADELHRMVSGGIGVSLSDGGEPASDVFADASPADWKKKVEKFLKV